MPILNYTTEVDVMKTMGAIQGLLVSKGARSIQIDYGPSGEPEALLFAMLINKVSVSFRLPAYWQGVLQVMKTDKKIPSRLKTNEQAKRVAWRMVKDWVEAQIAFIESGQVKAEQVFMPYALDQQGVTMFQRFEEQLKLLPPKPEESA